MSINMDQTDIPKEMKEGGQMSVSNNEISHAWDEIKDRENEERRKQFEAYTSEADRNDSAIDHDFDILGLSQHGVRYSTPDFYTNIQTKDNISSLGQEYLDFIETQSFAQDTNG